MIPSESSLPGSGVTPPPPPHRPPGRVIKQICNLNHHNPSVGAQLTEDILLLGFSDIENEGTSNPPNYVFTITFSKTPGGMGLQATQFTQQNFTAGVAATRSLLPVSSPLTPLDTIVSAFSLNTPYSRSTTHTSGSSACSLLSPQVILDGVSYPTPRSPHSQDYTFSAAPSFPIEFPLCSLFCGVCMYERFAVPR